MIRKKQPPIEENNLQATKFRPTVTVLLLYDIVEKKGGVLLKLRRTAGGKKQASYSVAVYGSMRA